MKRMLIVSIVLVTSCKLQPVPGTDTQQKDTLPTKDSTIAKIDSPNTGTPPMAAYAKLKSDTTILGINCRKLEKEKKQLVLDTAQQGKNYRALLSENKTLKAKVVKDKPVVTRTDNTKCTNLEKENSSLKKSVQQLTIRVASLEGEKIRMTKSKPDSVAVTNKGARQSTRRGQAQTVKEQYEQIFKEVNGKKN